MLEKNQIVPWRCHVCGREFDTMSGGVCGECGRVTCHVCFGLVRLKKTGRGRTPAAGRCGTCGGVRIEKNDAT